MSGDLYNTVVNRPDGSLSKQAVISDCGRYRYRLTRILSTGDKSVCFVMLNPSTADELVDDPTIRKCIGFATRWGFGCVEVVNLFGWRATDPKALKHQANAHGFDTAAGPDNDSYILQTVTSAALVVFAWGVNGQHFLGRVSRVQHLIGGGARGVLPMCLGYTNDGHPKHPLMLPYTTKLERYVVR